MFCKGIFVNPAFVLYGITSCHARFKVLLLWQLIKSVAVYPDERSGTRGRTLPLQYSGRHGEAGLNAGFMCLCGLMVHG